MAFGSTLTSDFDSRMMDIPEGMEKVTLRVPDRYANKYVSQAQAKLSADLFDHLFQAIAETEILRMVSQGTILKEEAIRRFKERYGITETLYPIGHLRRQLHRSSVPGLIAKNPVVEIRLSRKLSNVQCMQIYRLRKRQGLSDRAIAKAYKISHVSVQKIFKKVSARVSKKLPVSYQKTAA